MRFQPLNASFDCLDNVVRIHGLAVGIPGWLGTVPQHLANRLARGIECEAVAFEERRRHWIVLVQRRQKQVFRPNGCVM